MNSLVKLGLAMVALVGLSVGACGPTPTTAPSPTAVQQPTTPPGPTRPPAAGPTPPPATAAAQREYTPRVEVVASRLEIPWSLAFAPDGRLFFTERPGRVRVMSSGQLQAEPVALLPVASTGEAGLMGLALDPQFSQNHFLYVMYSYRDRQGFIRNRVSRLTEANNRASEEKVLLEDIPGASIHDGGRLKFGPDGKLYATSGDSSLGALAQDTNALAGKIHRMDPDGSVPADNPFGGKTIYSFGHRNPQGLAWDSRTGTMFSTEHGPVGKDEVNVIEPGRNYGWPEVSGQVADQRFVEPILSFSPSIAPSGATFYDGQQLWKWRGDLFFAALTGKQIQRLTLKTPDFRTVESHERLYEGVYGRLRDIIQGPDGFLYFATNNRDGRGSPVAEDDRILRVVPGSP